MSGEISDPDPREVESLAGLCRRFGATPPQDHLMARKLLERAGQLALTRGTDKLEALQYLLSLMKQARENAPAGDSAPQEGLERPPSPEKMDFRQENH